MNHTEQDLETVLRHAPAPKASEDLERILISQAPTSLRHCYRPPSWGAWLRRWWTVLAPASVSVACAVAITAQQMEIRDLKQALRAVPNVAESLDSRTNSLAPSAIPASGDATIATDPQSEIERLKELVARLTQEISRLDSLRTENQKLRAELASPRLPDFTPQETEALQKAKDKADSIACVNNLKQIGLSLRTWALDNDDAYPPNFQVMSNELSTPKLLVCPADTSHTVARDFVSLGASNCSYEYLAPVGDEKPELFPQRVMVRCPIHGNIELADGSVQMGMAKNHPDWFVVRDGKLYFEPSANKPEPAPQPQPNQ